MDPKVTYYLQNNAPSHDIIPILSTEVDFLWPSL